MHGEWGQLERVVEDAAITVGIAVLIMRQFFWRSTHLHRMLRMPFALIGVGLGYLAIELWGGIDWVPADWIAACELALVAATGSIMGRATRFRRLSDHLQYRLSPAGIWLWALFIAIRAGSFYLAAALGATVSSATGLLLLSFGVNRLAALLVVRSRAERLPPAPA